jgi:hypothetical protein
MCQSSVLNYASLIISEGKKNKYNNLSAKHFTTQPFNRNVFVFSLSACIKKAARSGSF